MSDNEKRHFLARLQGTTHYRKVRFVEGGGDTRPTGNGPAVQWAIDLRAELANFAAEVKDSGRVCPVCEGDKWVVVTRSGITGRGEITGVRRLVGKHDPMSHLADPCPHCSVDRKDWVDCDACKGSGKTVADNPADHAMFDPTGGEYAAYARAGGRKTCTVCKGRGGKYGPKETVALGKIYDWEVQE